MKQLADRITRWCYDFEMIVGIKKCGVMCVGCGKEAEEEADRLHAKLKLDPPKLCGQDVPVVDEYVYLGLTINRRVSVDEMASGRLEKASKAYRKIQPFLSSQHIPISMRVTVFRAVVGATLLYGSEVWGMSQQRCKLAQTLVNKAIRIMMQCKETDSGVRMAAMWRELNIPPVHAEASARRARALVKYPNLKTWIGVLAKYPYKTQQSTWYSGGITWMKRYNPTVNRTAMGRPSEDYKERAEQAYSEVLDAVWKSMEKGPDGKASKPYFTRRYEVTSWATSSAIPSVAREEQVRLGRGLRLLHLCRASSWWVADKMAWQHIEGMEEYKDKCPCCGEADRETVRHILLRCPRWEEQRQKHLGGIMRAATNLSRSVLDSPMGSGSCFEEKIVVVMMLGGEVDGRRVQSWLPPASGSSFVDCGAFQIARFLQSIEPSRRELIAPNPPLPNKSNARRANARKGKAAQAKSLGKGGRGGSSGVPIFT
jgi:hypothetical protein